MTTYREKLRQAAQENDGYITPDIAKQHGVPAVELRKLASRGAFEKKQRGVYRDPYYPPVDEFDYVREALLNLGDGAFITAETVLEVLGIGQLNPRDIHIASPKRHTRQIPKDWKITKADPRQRVVKYKGLASQPVADALREVRPRVMPDRWMAMVTEAREEGLIRSRQYEELKEMA